MKVSFVIPAYNEEEWIGRCIESAMKEVTRHGGHAEVIVVNNASTDRTKDIALSFPGVKVVDEPRKGVQRARQAGYLASSNDLLAYIDADTIVPEGWLDRVVREFSADEDLVALSGPYVYYDISIAERILVRVFYLVGYAFYKLNRLFGLGAMIQGGNFVVRRRILEKIGGHNTAIDFYGDDTDMARRFVQVGTVKWTFDLPMHSSGRRLRHEGIWKMGVRYALNFLWTTYLGRPFSKRYIDVRTSMRSRAE